MDLQTQKMNFYASLKVFGNCYMIQMRQRLSQLDFWALCNKVTYSYLLAQGRLSLNAPMMAPNAPWNFRGDFIKGLLLSFNIQNIDHNFVMDVSMVKCIL